MKGASPLLLHQSSVPQIQAAQHVQPRAQPVPQVPQVPQPVPVQPPVQPPVQLAHGPVPLRQAGQPVYQASLKVPFHSSALQPQPPRKDVVVIHQGRAPQNGYSHSHTPASSKSWPVTYARVPSPYLGSPEVLTQVWPKLQAVPSLNRRSSCILRPSELLSARGEAPGTNAQPAGLKQPGIEGAALPHTAIPKNVVALHALQAPDVKPAQSRTDATLLTVWPDLPDDDSRDPHQVPQKERGHLTPEEKLDYRDLKFVEHLGSGEFGQVFRGFYRGQEVAIKQLYWDNTVLPQVIIQDLTREIESFRHLRHKRLVNFVGACLEIPNLCIVTEYAPGGSLHHLLHVRKLHLPLLHCTNMCLQLAEGVAYLHSQNPIVVHRDLKSLNVVLDLSLNLKLCDFGLTESMERTHITKKNNGGSPRYMAPELFDSKLKITEKVDIWSMGCIFTEINGGPLPYEGINTLAELTREMLVNRRTPSIPPTIAEPLQVVISACYNFDARLRPSARQVYDQLREGKKKLQTQGLLTNI